MVILPNNSIIRFFEVLNEGNTDSKIIETGPPLPSKYKLITIYDVSTTANYSGPIIVVFAYDITSLSDTEKNSIKILHYEDGQWIDVTDTEQPDDTNGTISGTVDSLSLFAVVVEVETTNLTITKAGTGSGTVTSSPAGINCGADCSESYISGTVVTLTASPDTGSTFAGWSGDSDCSDGQVTMTANKTCTATFNLRPPEAFAVSGFIRSSKKDPIGEAMVEARDPAGTLVGTALTDDQGGYQLDLPPGKYTLTPVKETHLFSPASMKVTVKSKDISRRNFTCKRFQISGKVKERKNKPFPEVTVYIKQGGSTVGSSITDAKGKYAFWFYNTGTYTVEPVNAGSSFNPPHTDVIITRGSKGKVNFKEVQ